MNIATIGGTVVDVEKLTTRYEVMIRCKRGSGKYDDIRVWIDSLAVDEISIGERLLIQGEFQTVKRNTFPQTEHYVLAIGIKELWGEDVNRIFLSGTVIRKPVYRKTPKGRIITELKVSVERASGLTDHIPCVAWEKNADYASRLRMGAEVGFSGRIQSRQFIKEINGVQMEHTTHEISIADFE